MEMDGGGRDGGHEEYEQGKTNEYKILTTTVDHTKRIGVVFTTSCGVRVRRTYKRSVRLFDGKFEDKYQVGEEEYSCIGTSLWMAGATLNDTLLRRRRCFQYLVKLLTE